MLSEGSENPYDPSEALSAGSESISDP